MTYSTCTTVGNDKPWCSVEVDDNQNYISGKWENCKTTCDKGNVYFKDTII